MSLTFHRQLGCCIIHECGQLPLSHFQPVAVCALHHTRSSWPSAVGGAPGHVLWQCALPAECSVLAHMAPVLQVIRYSAIIMIYRKTMMSFIMIKI